MSQSPFRRLAISVACMLVLTACGAAAGTESDSAAAENDSVATQPDQALARRAAAQLEVEAIPGTGGGPFEGRELDPPLVEPRFTLTDTSGEPFDLARDATGPVTLLYFGYTGCPDVCPTHMAAIAKALSDLPAEQAERVDVVFVSVDTVNDDGQRLRDYLDRFDPSFVGLTGTADQVDDALQSIGLPPTAIGDADEFPPQHPSDVLAYTADGRAHVSYPFGTAPSAFEADIPRLIDADWNS